MSVWQRHRAVHAWFKLKCVDQQDISFDDTFEWLYFESGLHVHVLHFDVHA